MSSGSPNPMGAEGGGISAPPKTREETPARAPKRLRRWLLTGLAVLVIALFAVSAGRAVLTWAKRDMPISTLPKLTLGYRCQYVNHGWRCDIPPDFQFLKKCETDNDCSRGACYFDIPYDAKIDETYVPSTMAEEMALSLFMEGPYMFSGPGRCSTFGFKYIGNKYYSRYCQRRAADGLIFCHKYNSDT